MPKEIADSTKTSHKQGVWVTAKQKLFQPADQTDRGLTGFVNLTFHDSDTNKVDNMQNIGLVYKGLLNQRPQDELALGVARIHINDDWAMFKPKNTTPNIIPSFTMVFMPLTG